MQLTFGIRQPRYLLYDCTMPATLLIGGLSLILLKNQDVSMTRPPTDTAPAHCTGIQTI